MRWPVRISQPGGAGPAIQNNLNATSAPTVNDDSTVGYSEGSLWVWPLGANSIGYGTWICTDATPGAAVWRRIEAVNNLAGGAAPGVTNDASEEYSAGSVWIWPGNGTWICADPAIGAAVWTLVSATGSSSALSLSGAWTAAVGVAVGDVVVASAANTVSRADSTSVATAIPFVGIVSALAGFNATVVYAGEFAFGAPVLVPNFVYFLGIAPGSLTAIPPTGPSGSVVQRVGYAKSATVLVLDQRGEPVIL